MEIRENEPLKNHTTFHIGGPARYFIDVALSMDEPADTLSEAFAFAKKRNLPVFILGGGSNVLVSDRGFDGVVIRPHISGFRIDGERVRIGASENWDECARKIVEAGLWGIENLSFVPGTAAGLAVQNVGAYGQEARNVFDDPIDVYDIKRDTTYHLCAPECNFGYRSSIFNTTKKGEYVIMAIMLKLSRNGTPNTSYGLKPGTIQQMRDQVIALRKSKGQDPSEYWSAGSFFKNPIIMEEQYAKLPVGTPRYTAEGGVKVPAGYLLDKLCNLKGLTVGGAKLSELQVINIINTGNATADDVLTLFKKARNVVFQKTGIMLENEPELVGF